MKLLKNVLKGYMAHEEINRVVVIDMSKLEPIYSGTLEDFQSPVDCMKDFKQELENKEVIKADMSCGCQLFIFV